MKIDSCLSPERKARMKRTKRQDHKPHRIEIEDKVGKLTAYTKKDKPVVALFDVADLEKVEAFSNWRAVWDTRLDGPTVENKAFNGGRAIRMPVAAAILGCSPNAPIRHLNGDVLDNRQSNLEIYDVKGQPNDYEVVESRVVILLRDRYGHVVGKALIDQEDLTLVVQGDHVWLRKRRSSGQPYVVNQDGLLLAHLLLGVESGFVEYVNKNPLDNRRGNIKCQEEG